MIECLKRNTVVYHNEGDGFTGKGLGLLLYSMLKSSYGLSVCFAFSPIKRYLIECIMRISIQSYLVTFKLLKVYKTG